MEVRVVVEVVPLFDFLGQEKEMVVQHLLVDWLHRATKSLLVANPETIPRSMLRAFFL